MDAVVRPSSMIGSSQYSSVLSQIKMNADSDSERMVSALVEGPATSISHEDCEADGDEEDDTEDEYEFQDDYIYDITSRLKEVNAEHFAEPAPTAKEHKVRFADNPVDRVVNYSPTPLMDIDERLQLKKEYLMKLFAKDESERGDGQSDDSDLFSSSNDDDDFIDNAKPPSPVVELPQSPTSNHAKDGYEYADEVEKNGVKIEELKEDDHQLRDELDNKIMQLIECSIRSPGYQAGKEAAESLGSRIKSTIQESLKKEHSSATDGDQNNETALDTNETTDTATIESPSPEPPRSALNDSTIEMTTQVGSGRQPPKDLAIKLGRSPPSSPKKLSSQSSPPSNRDTRDRLSVPLNRAAFPPSPTRFIRKSVAQEANSASNQKRPRPPSSSTSSDTVVSTVAEKEVKKLPSYTGNERSRYGLPTEEKAKIKEERDKLKKEKEEKARQEEKAKRQRKVDAQKTFEAWLKNKETEKKNPSVRKKVLCPQPNDEEFDASPNTKVSFLIWLEGKKIQEKQTKLQHKLRQIELEDLEKKHTRQDAQQAYRRWLRKKALENEQQKVLQRQKIVEHRLSASSLKSMETLDRFFQSQHFPISATNSTR